MRRKLCLLEIRRYPDVQRHECHQLLPRRDVTAKGNGFLRHVPGKRRDQACIADVELRLFDLSLQGFQACFGPRDLHPGDVNLRCRPRACSSAAWCCALALSAAVTV